MSSTTTSRLFPGYNLRGLIFAYLEEHGWVWSDADESWSRQDVKFSGPSASHEAMYAQSADEEGWAA